MKPQISTSIEQSKKLIELGIDRNTADMCWQNNEFPIGFNDDDDIPAWSLSALLELMPIHKTANNNYIPMITNSRGYGSAICEYMDCNDNTWHTTCGKTSLEAALNMIVWLLENNYIKTNKQ